MLKKIAFGFLVFAFFASAAYAYEAVEASPWTTETTYQEKALGKLEFGLINGLLGWTEIISEPYQAHKAGGNAWQAIGTGTINAVLDTVGGALHIATTLIPVDVPLPEGGTDILDIKS